MTAAIFIPDGDLLVPQPAARANWYPDALHGGPVAAAFARAFEAVDAPSAMLVTRLTVDLLRPVPTEPLAIETGVVRNGKRIQVLEARMTAAGMLVAVASALRLRLKDVSVPDYVGAELFEPPDGLPPADMQPAGEPWFHTIGVDVRSSKSDFFVPGPGRAWVRLKLPVVAGEEPTPLQRVAAAADFGNGVGNVLGHEYVFMNADLSIHLHRAAVGGWVGLRSRSEVGDDGIGLAHSELFDTEGPIGRSLQVLFVDTVEDFGA